ncbi:MAG: serine/threonine protein kinase [Verrucomicrobia bacterium]|nr:serine/threonine protein kinase [Verrucomicrobiota bacterium]
MYEAEQIGAYGFAKKVALKLIEPSTAGQAEVVKAFIGEARLVARLVHPNIAQVYNLGRTSNHIFIVMELVHGMNCQELLARLASQGSRLPRDFAVYIVHRMLRGLSYAHSLAGDDGKPLGLVHRDAHLRNILVSYQGDVKLTDFGIARARGFLPKDSPDVIVGRPDFMSPEQITGKALDLRSDVFTAGVALATLLLNHNPFAGENLEDTRRRITVAPLPDFAVLDSRIDPELCDILRRSLERDPDKRFSSAEAMMNDLERYLFINRVGPNTESLRRFMQDFLKPADDDTRILSRAELDMPPLQETEDLVLPPTQSLPMV